MNKIELLKWSCMYDDYSYPPQVYNDLVVQRLYTPNRFEILGAWKGGCIRKNKEGSNYIDSNSEHYSFTNRWAYHTPVSRLAWEKLDEISNDIKNGTPEDFPTDAPEVFDQLMKIKGFSFILSTFVLHSINPNSYPLYDQHVYRSFKALTGNKKLPKTTSKSWKEYYQYREFFNHLMISTKLPYWIIDRALWAYGKKIKKHERIDNTKSQNEKWLNNFTLGKSKAFQWRVTENYNVEIKRDGIIGIEVVTSKDIDTLQEYLKDADWHCLSNNVEKLHKNTEIKGIGWFLYNKCGYTPTQAQLSSHIGALFSAIGIWKWNNKKRGIKFRQKSIVWKPLIKEQYKKEINAF